MNKYLKQKIVKQRSNLSSFSRALSLISHTFIDLVSKVMAQAFLKL